MSSRLLKKFLKEQNRDEINKINQSVETESLPLKPGPKKKKQIFKYLEESQSDENTSESTTQVEGDEKTILFSKNAQNQNKQKKGGLSKKDTEQHTKQETEENKKKKNKKKKKKKNKDDELEELLNKIGEEQYEKQKQERNIKNPKHPSNSNSNINSGEFAKENHELREEVKLWACTHEKYKYCLKLEKNNFDVNIELKRIFGKDFVKENKFVKKSKIKYLKNWLVQDYSTKTIQAPLTMKYVENEFKIEKEKLYLEAENLFYLLLDTHDIQSMNDLIKKYPFHIDTILILAEYYNETNNYEVANQYIKMALLLLQNIFHMNFNIDYINNNHKIYVNPQLYDNKVLFKTLYMHMQSLEYEGCTITSLEIAKLLCKIDLCNDLCGILLRIDGIMLKGNVFEFLVFFSFNFILQNIHYVMPLSRTNEIISDFFFNENDIKNGENCITEKLNPNEEISHNNIPTTNQSTNEISKTQENILKMECKENISSLKRQDGDIFDDEKIIYEQFSQNNDFTKKLPEQDRNNDKLDYLQNTHTKKKYDFQNYEIRLHFILPNFAFSIPLCLYLKNNTNVNYNEINEIKKNDILSSFSYEECKFLIPHFNINFNCYWGNNNVSNLCDKKNISYSLSYSSHLFLIRALLFYPDFVQIFVKYNNFNTSKIVKNTIYDISFKHILSHPPFSDNTLFSNKEEYEIVQKIILAYLEKNNIYYKSEKMITWVHVCSAFIHEMYKDELVAKELDEARKQWHRRIPLLDINKYKGIRVSEFKSRNYLLPDFMMEKTVSHPAPVPNTTSQYYVSLDSNVLVAFFQCLLPWYQVDYYGTHSRPVYLGTILETVIEETKRFLNI
ncbi:transcription factor 25, putative [Plasmodium yoelii]|uniref:Transcription factor 25 n=3 Tax=Plasmodium yoelii TaxID=5861 RepID=A0AAE9WTS0_PLAYO|nr:transcription factor 25, putative [Plasmodium yoelii]WBY58445.1 transcription factor 25 [Plasmodium yoelii yoelii]CDU18769.1 transcription factor 25, putative [Plasmodium yoelii]VTZ79354.1 transcription factor 25, putative [Plasmodium yoelii]|eukprot:XP_022812353.1 transcription factor 25, putative [Plasmodium yoelii]